MNNHNQDHKNLNEILSSLDSYFKLHILELQQQLDYLENLVEQLERRLRNLRNEG